MQRDFLFLGGTKHGRVLTLDRVGAQIFITAEDQILAASDFYTSKLDPDELPAGAEHYEAYWDLGCRGGYKNTIFFAPVGTPTEERNRLFREYYKIPQTDQIAFPSN